MIDIYKETEILAQNWLTLVAYADGKITIDQVSKRNIVVLCRVNIIAKEAKSKTL